MTAVKLDELSKRFGDREVFRAVTLRFEPGRIYGLIGRNGSGKSVLMKCIAGLVRPSGGTVEVFGRQVGRDVDFAPDTGIAIEQPGLLLRKSAYDNMKILSALTGRPCGAEIARLIGQVGLDPGERKPVGKYSMGMKQRLSIAMALLGGPRLLLLDEPMSNLDARGAEEMRALFRRLADEGRTIVVATHVQADISELCDEVCHMEDYRVAAQ